MKLSTRLLITPPALVVVAAIMLALPAFSQGIKVVIAEGIGGDPQDAAQNAAQNALTQVVGSFMDANTLLEKRTQIQDGIRAETKQIKKDVREYSQGMIQSFEILETRQEDKFYRVSARVEVRVATFSAYAKRLAESTSEIGAGLFAEVKTALNQSESLVALLAERLNAIAVGEVQEFTVGNPIPYARVQDQLRAQGIAANSNAIVIPITSKLTSSFMENLSATFQATAVATKKYSCSFSNPQIPHQREWACLRDGEGFWGYGEGDKKFSVAVPDKNNWKRNLGAQVYKFNLTREELGSRLRLPDTFLNYSRSGRYPKLRLTIKAGNGDELFSDEVVGYGTYGARSVTWASSEDSIREGVSPPWFMFYPKNKLDLIVLPENSFYIILSIDVEQLKKATSMVVSIAR